MQPNIIFTIPDGGQISAEDRLTLTALRDRQTALGVTFTDLDPQLQRAILDLGGVVPQEILNAAVDVNVDDLFNIAATEIDDLNGDYFIVAGVNREKVLKALADVLRELENIVPDGAFRHRTINGLFRRFAEKGGGASALVKILRNDKFRRAYLVSEPEHSVVLNLVRRIYIRTAMSLGGDNRARVQAAAPALDNVTQGWVDEAIARVGLRVNKDATFNAQNFSDVYFSVSNFQRLGSSFSGTKAGESMRREIARDRDWTPTEAWCNANSCGQGYYPHSAGARDRDRGDVPDGMDEEDARAVAARPIRALLVPEFWIVSKAYGAILDEHERFGFFTKDAMSLYMTKMAVVRMIIKAAELRIKSGGGIESGILQGSSMVATYNWYAKNYRDQHDVHFMEEADALLRHWDEYVRYAKPEGNGVIATIMRHQVENVPITLFEKINAEKKAPVDLRDRGVPRVV